MMERWKGGQRGARFSPAHLQLHHPAVVLELHHLLAKEFIIRHHFEVVSADEVLQSDQVAGRAVGRDPIARVVLLDATQELYAPRSDDVAGEGIPTAGRTSVPSVGMPSPATSSLLGTT